MTLFENSVRMGYIHHDTALRQLSEEYKTSEQPIDPKTGLIHATAAFPPELDKQPLAVLKDEFVEYKKNMINVRVNGERLVSKMMLYFKNDVLEKDFGKIRIQSGKCGQYVQQTFESTTPKDFESSHKNSGSELNELEIEMKEFEIKLVNEKIRKISV